MAMGAGEQQDGNGDRANNQEEHIDAAVRGSGVGVRFGRHVGLDWVGTE